MQKVTANTTEKIFYFLLILLSFVVYGNSIQNEYAFDDSFVVKANPYVQKGTAGIQEILDMPYARLGEYTLDRRPIALITFALEHQFIGDNPHASHLINILLFALTLIVMYTVLKKVFHLDAVYSLLPFIVTLFFAVHPIHTEVVDSLKNRDEILVLLFGMLFMLFGYYFYIKERGKYWYAALSLFFLALTLLSKITGLVFVGIFIMVSYFEGFFKQKKWNYIFIILCLWLVFKAMIKVFETLNRTTTVFENPLTQNDSIWISLGTASSILLYHIKMLLFPSPLRFYYGANMFPLVSLTDPSALFSFIFHLGLLAYGTIRYFKKDNLGLFILCYFAAIALYANFPIPYTSMFSERALLLSSLWFIVILGVLAVRLWNKYNSVLQTPFFRNSLMLLLTAVFVMYSFMTISRNFLWKDTLTLMSHDIESLDNSVLANFIYANNLKYESKTAKDSIVSRELAEKAVYYYGQAINLKPNYPEFYFKLASTYRYNLNNLDSAEVNFGYAISIDSLYRDAKFELSKLFFDRKDYRRSYYFFRQTYDLNPKDSLTLFYYAQSAANIGDMATCYKINREFLKLYPDLQYPYLNLGTYYAAILKDDSAVIYFDKAVELGYREPELLNKLGYYFEKKGDAGKADYYRSLNK